jgi:chromosomal replication initiation ATPase DnaA
VPATPPSVIDALRARDLLGITEQVARRRGVTVADLCSRSRTRAVAYARHELWWTIRHDPDRHLSLAEIGALFGRDHATVHHGLDAHRARLAARSADTNANS